MNLSWMLGPTMAQRHLLYAYLVVWVVQGGYAAWVAWQWWRTRREDRP